MEITEEDEEGEEAEALASLPAGKAYIAPIKAPSLLRSLVSASKVKDGEGEEDEDEEG